MLDETAIDPGVEYNPRGKYYNGVPKKAANWKDQVQHSEQTSASDGCEQSSNLTNATHSTSMLNPTKRRSSNRSSTSNNDKSKKKRKTSANSASITAHLQAKHTAETRNDTHSSGHSSQNTKSRTSSQEITLGSSAPSSGATPSRRDQRRNSKPTIRKRSLVKLLVNSGDNTLSPLLIEKERINFTNPFLSSSITNEPEEIPSEQCEAPGFVTQFNTRTSTQYSSIGSCAGCPDYYEPEPVIEAPVAEAGVRRALVIGIQYRNQIWPIRQPSDPKQQPSIHRMDISGPHADARDMFCLLVSQGYHPDNIRFMTDEPETPEFNWPTRNNLISAFEELVAGAKPSDTFFVYFAGHGIQVDDEEGDEDDGQDETIIPCDWATVFRYSNEGLIKDDYLRINYIDKLPAGSQLMGVFDACHSGTIFDLPECYPRQTYDEAWKKARDGSPPSVRAKMESPTESRNPHKPVVARVMCLSACMDSQRAYETKAGPLGEESRGLFTTAFTRTFKKFRKQAGRNPTAKELYEAIQKHLRRPPPSNRRSPPPQDPLLTTSSPMTDEMKRIIVL